MTKTEDEGILLSKCNLQDDKFVESNPDSCEIFCLLETKDTIIKGYSDNKVAVDGVKCNFYPFSKDDEDEKLNAIDSDAAD